MLLGDGVVAGVLLKRSKSENAGWMVVTAGWAFAVLCGIFTALLFGSKDGHLNPAITLAFAIQGHDFSKLLPFAAARCSAAIVFCRAPTAPNAAGDAVILQGGGEAKFLAALKRDFASVKHVKPPASRTDSAELYLLARGFRGSGRG